MSPVRTSRWRSPSWRLRMKVESKLIVIAGSAVAGLPGPRREAARRFLACGEMFPRPGLDREQMPQQTSGTR